jgi:hypothetical protein
MPYEYLLPLTNRTAQNITRTGATSAISGTLSLSAATTLVVPSLSGTTTVSNLSVAFTLTPNSTLNGVSATSTGISLTQGTRLGNVIVYGKVDTSTFVASTSTITATIKFNDPNYVTTNIDISARGTSAIALSTSVLDNPLVILATDGDYTATFSGLTSTNMVYRTVGRQVRLRQGYEA